MLSHSPDLLDARTQAANVSYRANALTIDVIAYYYMIKQIVQLQEEYFIPLFI